MKMLFVLLCAMLVTGLAVSEEPLKVLYLTKSAGFEHSVVKRPEGGELSFSEKILTKIVEDLGGTIVCTKDADQVSAENLKNFNLAVFYTTGVLTKESGDGGKPMSETGCAELLDWIRAGGGFVGLHSANDTFHSQGDKVSDFVEMIGGEFQTHGRQFKGTLRIVSPGHPALDALPDGYTAMEEWYVSKNLNKEKMHVLALLDPGRERKRQDTYNVPSYPIIWCRAYGEGRVLYNALGHREDLVESEAYKKLLIANFKWAMGEGDLDAAPNYAEAVPTAIEENAGEK